MKILLMRPPAHFTVESAQAAIGLPLGLLSIAAVLEQSGFEISIFDALVNPEAPRIIENNTVHVGYSWDEIRQRIIKYSPDIVGISGQFTAQNPSTLALARLVKSVNSAIYVVAGGNSPTVSPELFLNGGAVDMVCRGEGEETMVDIARAIDKKEPRGGIPGTVTMSEGRCSSAPARPFKEDLDELPLPAYHLIDLERYFAMNALGFSGRPVYTYPGSERAVSIVTSRGCPFNCIFCSIHLHMGRKWRSHSADYVARHIQLLKDRYNIRHLHFEDDNLTLDMERFSHILDSLSGKHLTWDTPNGIRPDRITEALVQKCRDLGCTYLIVGIESGNKRVLSEIINKDLNLNKAEEMARWCHAAGLDLGTFFVMGFPGETIPEMEDTAQFALRLMKRYDAIPSIFTASPLIGTRLYDVCFEKGYLRSDPAAEEFAAVTGSGGKRAIIETEEFTAADIFRVIRSFMHRYKPVFCINVLLFLLKNPFAVGAFAWAIIRERRLVGLKKSFLKAGTFKNCINRRHGLEPNNEKSPLYPAPSLQRPS